jgi:hypothetical protein
METMLSAFTSDIYVVKTASGMVYWPAFGYNSIGNMNPGEGYKIRMINGQDLLYPANTAAVAKSQVVVQTPVYFSEINRTGNNMTLGIPAESWNEQPAIGDEIGVYGSNGLLTGAAVYQGGDLVVTLWGDDNLTSGIEGLTEGEQFMIHVYNQSGKTTRSFVISSWIEGDGRYSDDAIQIAGKLQSVAGTPVFSISQNAPNPASIYTEVEFTLPVDLYVTINVYNVLGEKVGQIEGRNFSAGNHTIKLDVSEYNAGNYFYTLTAGAFEATRQMTVVR